MNSDYLEHHGILGMHLGHRKTKSFSNKNRKKSSKSSKVFKGSKLKSALKTHKKALIAAGVVGGTAALCAINPVFGKVLGNTICSISIIKCLIIYRIRIQNHRSINSFLLCVFRSILY